jgi:tRNA pseudouridine38-40 synthase
MVRIIAGTLIEIGNDRRPVTSIREALEAKNRSAAGPTAPAEGLTMISWTAEENLLTH